MSQGPRALVVVRQTGTSPTVKALAALTMCVILFAAGAADAHKAVIVVRHAEKASQTDPDTPLSVSGEDRALGLARLLRNSGVTHVVVSDKKRTAQTAEPLTDQTGLKPLVITEVPKLIEALKAMPKDAVVVVVHHSNTVPDILKGLGVKAEIKLKDDQYGRVFVVQADGSLLELAY